MLNLNRDELLMTYIHCRDHDWSNQASITRMATMENQVQDQLPGDTLDDWYDLDCRDVMIYVSKRSMMVLHQRIEALNPPSKLWISRRGKCNAIIALLDERLFDAVTSGVTYEVGA